MNYYDCCKNITTTEIYSLIVLETRNQKSTCEQAHAPTGSSTETLFSSATPIKSTITERVCYWNKDRHIDEWNIIDSPEIDSQIYGPMIFSKDTKTIQWGKHSLFNKIMLGKLDICIQKNEVGALLYIILKNLKMDKKSKPRS